MFVPTIRKFATDKRGNVSQIFGLAIIPLLAALGGAIDFALLARSKSDAQVSLDGALLAAAHTARTTKKGDNTYQRDGKRVFDNEFIDTNASVRSVNFSRTFDNDGGQTVEATAEIATSTFILQLIGLKSWDAKVFSQTKIPPPAKFEVAMVLDITGSMGYAGNVAPLKEAAKNFLDIIFQTETQLDESWIGIVPYSQSVNIGNLAKRVATTYKTQLGFIMPTDGADYIANPPNSQQNVVERDGAAATNDAAPTGSNKYRIADDTNSRYPELPSMKILRPTDQKAPLVSTIDSIKTGGGTAGHMGFQWGLNMVSPKWANIWRAPSGTSPYTGPGAKKKFILMMTDGEFNYSPGASTGPGPGTRDYNGTFVKLCNFAKNNDVTVFTITFKAPASVIPVMQKCASPGKHIDAKSNAALKAAFEKIANEIQQFYLTG